MQDMLKKIVDMDEQARKLTEQAEEQKIESQKDIEQATAKIHNEYLERARKRIKTNEAAEKEAAEKKWLETQAAQEQAAKDMDALYAQKGQQWVQSIVENVINS